MSKKHDKVLEKHGYEPPLHNDSGTKTYKHSTFKLGGPSNHVVSVSKSGGWTHTHKGVHTHGDNHADLDKHLYTVHSGSQHTENKADKDDPRVQRAGFKREHNNKDFAHGMYHGGANLDTDHFHDKLVAKHGGSSGQLGNFAIPHKNVDAFHKAAKEAGYNHGEHYDLGSQHTEESVDRVYTEHLKSGGKPFIPRNTV